MKYKKKPLSVQPIMERYITAVQSVGSQITGGENAVDAARHLQAALK